MHRHNVYTTFCTIEEDSLTTFCTIEQDNLTNKIIKVYTEKLSVKTQSKMNLLVLIAGIFIMCCNPANSESVDCIALCDQCADVSDTLTHMGCTKHCEELKQNDNGKMSCSKLTAPNKGSLSLEDEINAINARITGLAANGDYPAIVEEFFTDDCINIVNGQAPVFGKEDMKNEWFTWFKSNHIDRITLTVSAFGDNNGEVWEDGISTAYHQDDGLIGAIRYMYVFKRVNGTLLHFITIYFD
ncbi:uncharacterized protein [Amphiura filiformis]|uniref:uncharacterized protein n=1 Tax=Amphiura filiformis TaxID=82378 RepID=UPI003B20F465